MLGVERQTRETVPAQGVGEPAETRDCREAPALARDENLPATFRKIEPRTQPAQTVLSGQGRGTVLSDRPCVAGPCRNRAGLWQEGRAGREKGTWDGKETAGQVATAALLSGRMITSAVQVVNEGDISEHSWRAGERHLHVPRRGQ